MQSQRLFLNRNAKAYMQRQCPTQGKAGRYSPITFGLAVPEGHCALIFGHQAPTTGKAENPAGLGLECPEGAGLTGSEAV